MSASFGRILAPAVLVAAAVLTHAPTVHAQNESGSAAAESLFQEGRKLMDAKRYAEACPKLQASYRLQPGVGTLLNLADCYERDGKLASAWVRFHDAIALAQRLGRPDREKTARERAEKLDSRLIKLSILTKEPALDVKLDGNPLDSAALSSPIPVDPGKHTVEVKASGKKPFTSTIEVSERSRTPSIEIPPLEVDPDADRKAAGKTESKSETKSESKVDEPKDDGQTQRIVGIVAMGVGAVGIGVGTIFGLRTSSKWDEAQKYCTGIDCDRTGVELATTAKNAGTVSTIAFIAGGALVAGGLVAFFTAPSAPPSSSAKSGAAPVKPPSPTTRVGIGPGTVVVGGTF